MNKINEGFDINKISHEISYNPNVQNFCDTSLEVNPTVTDFEGIKVYSILKRIKSPSEYQRGGNKINDGNPVIYALKSEKNWKFKTDRNKDETFKQINLILDKFCEKGLNFDYIITAPSSNSLNKTFLDLITSKINCPTLNEAFIKKKTIEALNDMICDNKNYLEFITSQDKEKQSSKARVIKNLAKLYKNCYGDLSSHEVCSDLRKFIGTSTRRAYTDVAQKIKPQLFGKSVLIVDDTFRTGETLQAMINILQNFYQVKSIVALTLFSKLYNN